MNLIPKFIFRRIEHRSHLVKIMDNIGWLFIDKILRMGVGLFVGVWVARYLGPEQYGLLNYALSFVALFAAIATLGFNGIVVRDLINYPESANTTLGSAFVSRLVGGLVAVLLISSSVVWVRSGDPLSQFIVIIISFGLVFKSTEVVKYWFESQVQSRYCVWVENAVFLFLAAVKVGLIVGKAPFIAFIWVVLVEAILIAVGLMAVYVVKRGKLRQWKPKWKRSMELLKDSWPLIASGLTIMIYMRIDQIMLGEMAGDEAVGLYAAAVSISEIWFFIPMIISASVFPSIIRSSKQNNKVYYDNLQRLYDFLVWVAIVIAVAVHFLGEWIVLLLFGDQFKAASDILKVHIWGGVLVFFGIARHKWILNHNLQRFEIWLDVIGAGANVLLNLVLIPHYGALGAAYATVLSYVAGSIIGSLLISKLHLSLVMYAKALFAPIRYAIGRN